MRGSHHSGVNRKPSFILKLIRNLYEELPVRLMAHLNIHKDLVASLVVWLNRQRLDVFGIHPVDINIDYKCENKLCMSEGIRTLLFELLKP